MVPSCRLPCINRRGFGDTVSLVSGRETDLVTFVESQLLWSHMNLPDFGDGHLSLGSQYFKVDLAFCLDYSLLVSCG